MVERAPWDAGPTPSEPAAPEVAPWDQAPEPRAVDPQPILDHLQNAPGMADAKNPLDAFYAGLQMSATGLVSGRPNMRLPENASFMDKLSAGFGQTLGDLPFSLGAMGAGAVIGSAGSPGVGTVIGGAVGFTAAPEAVRQTMLDYYNRGEIQTRGDFLRMLAGNAWEVGKAAVVGKAGMVAGKAGGSVLSDFSANGFAKTTGNVAGFTLGATEANAALEGKLPDAQDFALGAVNAVGFHVGSKVVGRVTDALKDVYRNTGLPPDAAAMAARKDPVLRDELIQSDVNGNAVTPKFYAQRPPSAEPFVKTDAPDPVQHATELHGILQDIGQDDVPTGLARKYGSNPEERPVDLSQLHPILDEADKALSGSAADAITAFVGHEPGKLKAVQDGAADPVGIMNAGPLERALQTNSQTAADLEASFSTTREKLRKMVGDEITLYRAQGNTITDVRHALSWSANPEFVRDYAGVLPDLPRYSAEQIAEHEKTLAEKGSVKIGRHTLKPNEYGSLDIFRGAHEHITDTDSVKDYLSDQNDAADERDQYNAKKAQVIISRRIRLDDVLWATNRAGQSEFITKNTPTSTGYVSAEPDAKAILADLSTRYNGDSEAALIAYRDGTDTASKYIASGRDPATIPDSTQEFLKHVQDAYGITGTWNTVDWEKFPTNKDTALTQFKDGSYKPTPEAIAGYLQDFGRRAGFRFVVSKRPQTSASGANTPQYVIKDLWSQRQGSKITNQWETNGARVEIPNTSEELNKRWYGLGRYEILYHEVGHALDHMVLNHGVNITNEISPELTEELTAISKQFKPKLWQDIPSHTSKPSELMADGVAVWLHRPDLRDQMPIFGKLHGEDLKPYVDMAARALPTRSEGGSGQWVPPPGPQGPEPHYGATPPAKAPPGGKPPGPPNPPETPDHNWDNDPLSYLLSRFGNRVGEQPIVKKKLQTGFEFELDAARRIDQTQLREGILKPGQATSEDMFRSTYASESRVNHFLRFGGLDPLTFKPTGGPSLKEVADLIDAADSPALEGWQDKRTAFNAYVLAERSIDKAKQNIDLGLFEPGEAETIRKRLKPVFGEAKDKLQQFNNSALDYLRGSGVISQAQMDAMIRMNPSYMSIRRIMGDDASFTAGQGRGKFFRVSNPLRKMEGSDRDITDPWAATVDNVRMMIKMADRNRAIGHIVGSTEIDPSWGIKRIEHGGATLAEPGSDTFKPYRFSPGEEDIVRPLSWRPGARGANQFTFYRDGKIELWEANDPNVARMIRGADSPGEINMLQKTLGLPAAIERLGVTGDPGFAFGIPLKHQWTAWISGEGHPPPYITAVKGMFHMLSMDEVYQQALANGALTHGALTDIDRTLVQTDALDTLDKTGALDKAWNVVRHPVQFSQMITESLTNASRVGNFSREVQKGADPFKAAMQSRTNYLDYAEQMTAQWAQVFAKWVPFFRAGILGLRQGAEAATERPGQTAAYAAMGLILPQIFFYAMNRAQDQFLPDDQKYASLPPYERDLYIHTPVIGPNGYRFRLAKPFVWGPLIGAPLERILESAFEANPHAFDGLLSEMSKDLTPSNIPAFAKPVVEQVANYNFFTGQPLISDRLKSASADLQYTDATTEPAKKISQVLSSHSGIGAANIPPIILDNYAREWGGTLGATVMKALGSVMKPESPDDWTETPFVKAFFIRHPGMNSTDVDNFYKDTQEFEQAHQDKVLEVQRGQLADARTDAVKQRVVTIEKFKHTLNLLREGIVRTNGNTTMTVDEKRQLTDQLVNEGIAYARLGSQVLKTRSYDPAIAQVLNQNINDSLHRALTPVQQ